MNLLSVPRRRNKMFPRNGHGLSGHRAIPGFKGLDVTVDSEWLTRVQAAARAVESSAGARIG